MPCLHGATCLERSNLTLYDMGIFSNFTFEEAGGFLCECVPGFEGMCNGGAVEGGGGVDVVEGVDFLVGVVV